MCDYVYICNEIDNGQEVKKVIIKFLQAYE